VKAAARRAAVLVGAALTLLVLSAAPAAAHPALVSSEPLAGYALDAPPEQLLLRFSEPVQLAARPLELIADDGTAVPLQVVQEDGGAVLRGAVDGKVRPGRYALRYDVVAADGDVVRGDVAFSVGVPAATGASRPAAPGVAADLAMPRAALFLGLALFNGVKPLP